MANKPTTKPSPGAYSDKMPAPLRAYHEKKRAEKEAAEKKAKALPKQVEAKADAAVRTVKKHIKQEEKHEQAQQKKISALQKKVEKLEKEEKKEKSAPKKSETKSKTEPKKQGARRMAKVQTLAERKADLQKLQLKHKEELAAYSDLKPKKAHKTEIAKGKEVSDSELKEAGERALKAREREKAKEQKSRKEAALFQKMAMYAAGGGAALGQLQDRQQMFAVLPRVIPSTSEFATLNDDLYVLLLTAGAASMTKSSATKKTLLAMSLAASSNIGRKIGANVSALDGLFAGAKAKLGVV